MSALPAIEVRRRPAVIVGSGVAGLTTALALDAATVLTKASLRSGSTPWSQGGIAAAIGADDSAALHAADTIAVSAAIGDAAAAARLTSGARAGIDRLLELGARFDCAADGTLALGREAGHSRRRILHAGGDATGAELARTLIAAALASPTVEVVEQSFAVDLLRSAGRVVGVLAYEGGRWVAYLSDAVVLATGGIGRVYARTTNPVEVTGDGLAIALRAGATVADLEFVQFHPTALAGSLDPAPLLTEALRGEGAVLVDGDGERFMVAEHPDAELAPRDVVARAIWRRLDAGGSVFLDATAAVGAAFPERFPTVYGYATAAGFDPRSEPLPVTPAAHYHMGGIAVDAEGRSSLDGLWASGEASSTGLHGANRLASNSLLEGLVFGAAVADSIARAAPASPGTEILAPRDMPAHPAASDVAAVAEVRELMWRHAGVTRTGAGLHAAFAGIERVRPALAGSLEGRNLAEVARAVTAAALARTESRGGHYRADHPEPDPAQAVRSFSRGPAAPAQALPLLALAG